MLLEMVSIVMLACALYLDETVGVGFIFSRSSVCDRGSPTTNTLTNKGSKFGPAETPHADHQNWSCILSGPVSTTEQV